MSFIPKYKYFSNPEGFQVYGYVNTKYIESVFVTLEKKGLFGTKALLVGDTNAQLIYFGTKEKCIEYMNKLIENTPKDIPVELLPEPEGVINTETKDKK